MTQSKQKIIIIVLSMLVCSGCTGSLTPPEETANLFTVVRQTEHTISLFETYRSFFLKGLMALELFFPGAELTEPTSEFIKAAKNLVAAFRTLQEPPMQLQTRPASPEEAALLEQWRQWLQPSQP